MIDGIEGGAVSDVKRVPAGVDPSKPNSARVYNYLLGGKDNYEVDQMLAHRMLQIAPDTKTLAWLVRKFMLQGAQLAAEAGVRQFIDIGAGIPASPSLHEAVQAIDASSKVVAVDYDAVVFAHNNALLAQLPGVTPMLADMRRPDDIIKRVQSEAQIDFSQPVAIVLVGVLHYIMDDENPAEIIARFHETLAPGSYFIFTHGSDESDPDFIAQSTAQAAGSTAQVHYRSRAEVSKYFDGFEMLGPGLAPVQEWLDGDTPKTGLVLIGGVGRKK
ncbi:SAM-dependent methyltransferase [Nocardia sp. NPDC004278]